MYEFLKNLDRRWVFLLMLLSVAVPILLNARFPEKPTGLARAVFNEIEKLNEGDPVLLAFDFDPASEGELGPMATAFVRHCAEKKVKMYFMSLWPVGPRMVEDALDRVVRPDFPDLKYGEDWVQLGYKSGYEAVIKVIVTDLKQLYTTDRFGASIDSIPLMADIQSVQDFSLVINISAGYAGTKEWVQYASTPYPDIILVAGCTGVQAPLLYPYIPEQLPGLLGAIKGAAEYEMLVLDKYGSRDENGELDEPGKYFEGIRRMGPQLIAHVLMILLIITGNIIFFIERNREGSS
ncbi:MAG: hypothetical protein IH891_06990 [Planctomycetes bacterium]|nr:hypothetical protein [Planctomycetota bacterium]